MTWAPHPLIQHWENDVTTDFDASLPAVTDDAFRTMRAVSRPFSVAHPGDPRGGSGHRRRDPGLRDPPNADLDHRQRQELRVATASL